MDINQLVRDLVADWFKQNGNKKNADVKRLISIIESILSHDTVKNAVYLGVGAIAIKVVLKPILDSMNEHYKIKCESELDKLMIQPSTMIVDNVDDIEDWTNIKEEE